MVSVSVVVPVYNEERTIVAILERVKAVSVPGVTFEVIVVDDGSKDRTREILDGRPDLYSQFIKHTQNRGKGGAVKTALAAATGDFVLFQDADLEYDPAEYPKLMKPVLDFGAEIVMGSRFIAPEYTRVFYFWHKVGNGLISLIFNILNNTTFTDTYSCYLMYRRDLVDVNQLQSEGWEQHAEILSLAVKKAKSLYEVPISYHGRSYDEGKKIKAYHALAVIWMMVRCALFR
ncbi:MAG: glycosyltransferase family 2 protein [Magnetospirillum sp.]